MKNLSLLLLSLAALSAASSVQAASTAGASASISGLTLTLVDLDPLDGIAPSLTFNSNGYYDNYGYANASQYDGTDGAYDSSEFGYLTSNPWFPGTAAATTPLASASASLTGNGVLDGSSLFVSGTATTTSTTSCVAPYPYQTCGLPYASFGAQVTAPYYYAAGTLTVSANTLVLIEAQGVVQATAEGGGQAVTTDYQNQPYTYYYGNAAYAQLGMSISGPAASGGSGGSQSSSDGLNLQTNTYWDGTQWMSYSYGGNVGAGGLGISFVNASDADMQATLSTWASVSGYAYGSSVAVVPEPGTYGLMLAGLLSVGAVVRRRGRA